MKRAVVTLILVLAGPLAGWADEAVERELERDVVLRALVDELERGRDGLELEDLERPYFIEYALLDAYGAHTSAELGAVTRRGEGHHRWMRADVRVGSYELDNTNFAGDYGGFRRGYTWKWKQIAGPKAQLASDEFPDPIFFPTEPGTYTFELVFSSPIRSSKPAACSVVVVK